MNTSSLNIAEFVRGYKAFEERESRDAMYKVASFIIKKSWGKPAEMADGLGVLLLTWNNAFYRYGPFDYDALESCIRKNLRLLKTYRRREIQSLSVEDEDTIKQLFRDFLQALQIFQGKMKGRRSPVGVAKALHLLAPAFFAIWDDKIARAYNCYYNNDAAESYVNFSWKTKAMAQTLSEHVKRRDKTLVKLIDEYNYAKYTTKWV
jgi:hypothetical protein